MKEQSKVVGRRYFLTTILALASGAWLLAAAPLATAQDKMKMPSSAAPGGGQAESGGSPAGPAGASGERLPAKKYTCPMHPEVVSPQPGRCPKCGMYLEEIKP